MDHPQNTLTNIKQDSIWKYVYCWLKKKKKEKRKAEGEQKKAEVASF